MACLMVWFFSCSLKNILFFFNWRATKKGKRSLVLAIDYFLIREGKGFSMKSTTGLKHLNPDAAHSMDYSVNHLDDIIR